MSDRQLEAAFRSATPEDVPRLLALLEQLTGEKWAPARLRWLTLEQIRAAWDVEEIHEPQQVVYRARVLYAGKSYGAQRAYGPWDVQSLSATAWGFEETVLHSLASALLEGIKRDHPEATQHPAGDAPA